MGELICTSSIPSIVSVNVLHGVLSCQEPVASILPTGRVWALFPQASYENKRPHSPLTITHDRHMNMHTTRLCGKQFGTENISLNSAPILVIASWRIVSHSLLSLNPCTAYQICQRDYSKPRPSTRPHLQGSSQHPPTHQPTLEQPPSPPPYPPHQP